MSLNERNEAIARITIFEYSFMNIFQRLQSFTMKDRKQNCEFHKSKRSGPVRYSEDYSHAFVEERFIPELAGSAGRDMSILHCAVLPVTRRASSNKAKTNPEDTSSSLSMDYTSDHSHGPWFNVFTRSSFSSSFCVLESDWAVVSNIVYVFSAAAFVASIVGASVHCGEEFSPSFSLPRTALRSRDDPLRWRPRRAVFCCSPRIAFTLCVSCLPSGPLNEPEAIETS